MTSYFFLHSAYIPCPQQVAIFGLILEFDQLLNDREKIRKVIKKIRKEKENKNNTNKYL